MAGGNANDIRVPHPGPGGLIEIVFNATDLVASQTDKIVDSFTAQYAFEVVAAECNAQVMAITNGITWNIEDDTATPKVPVANSAAAAVTLGASGTPTALTVTKGITINAGAIVKLSYISLVGDTATKAYVRMWVRPIFDGSNN